MSIIELRDLNKYFGQEPNRIHVLKDINVRIERGEFVAIIGQSGSGKSTLMNMLGCLDTPSSGSYRIDGQETAAMNGNELADLRSRTFGFIFQRYNLIGSINAVGNVAMPAVYAGVPHAERTARARELLTGLGLPDKFFSRPHQLSGGQQQRVSIARALMNGGEVILADEPTGALDSGSGENVMAILQELNKRGHTVILVTHDKQIAAYANRRIELKDGVVIADVGGTGEALPGVEKADLGRKAGRLHLMLSRLSESFSMSVQAILSHKMRSLLTMLGTIIGNAAVVSVVALGKGSQEKILSDISSIGTNTITVYPGTGYGDMRSGRVKTLTVNDSDMLGRQSYLDSSTPQTTASGVLVYRNVSVNAQVSGAGAQYFDVKGLKIESGRLFNADDVRNNASVVVIDPNTRDKLFAAGEEPLGKVIVFNKQPLQVIGVTKKQDTVFGPTDSLNLWAPYTCVMHKITGQTFISSIVVKVSDDVSSQVAEKNLTIFLTAKHGGKKDFFTSNSDSIKQTVENTTGTMTILISSIALISLIVGGIGVMNIMLVSVTERTREIGIRMAIGARQYNILEQFLLEAVLICLVGGLAGIALSGLIGLVFSLFVKTFALAYSLVSFLVALGCSTLIGVVFGFMPARNASELNPIEALSRD